MSTVKTHEANIGRQLHEGHVAHLLHDRDAWRQLHEHLGVSSMRAMSGGIALKASTASFVRMSADIGRQLREGDVGHVP